MVQNSKFLVTNIHSYLNSTNPEIDEKRLIKALSGFSCPNNPDVEYFLKRNAVEFTKKKQSVTYLVSSGKSKKLLGYFTLALKPLTVHGGTLSNTTKKKLLRVSELDEKSDTYTMSAFLIAQLGKNYSENDGKEITGAELLGLAWGKIKEIQFLRLL